MRILHVIPSVSLVHGGPSWAIAQIERALAARGVHIEVATTDDDGPGKRATYRLNPVGHPDSIAVRHYFAKRVEFYKVSPAFAHWIFSNARNYDLMHIHALFSFTSMTAAWAARCAGVPYVVRPLGTLNQYGLTQRRPWLKQLSLKLVEGPILRHAAAVHFTSHDEMREAAQTRIAMKGVVIPLGIDVFKPDKGDLVRASCPDLADVPYLLYLSRLDPVKNVEGLLRAFSLCASNWTNMKLLVAGDGDSTYVAGLKALASELRLTNRVVWAGHIDGDLKASALANATLFVLPSFSENFGIAAAEALMAGLPCVLGHGVAIAAEVVDAGAGVTVGTDPESIAAGLMQVMNSSKQRDAMAANAVILARSKYSAEAMGEKLVQLYSQISSGLVPVQQL